VSAVRAVTFDVGHTLLDLDTEFLARRLAERGARVDPTRARAEVGAAWEAYAERKRRGWAGEPLWKHLMKTLLTRAGASADGEALDEGRLEALTSWLFAQQPGKNLWRRPIPGMFELAAELRERGVRVGIVSNAEGGIAALLEELGRAAPFEVVADSGLLPFEKPDPRIFQFAADALEVNLEELVHVGDAWVADVEGVLAAGGRAVWFGGDASRALPTGVAVAGDAQELAAWLAAWGVR
jgi:putative hydrolase of the HAD superfamily